ncbi:MAG: hypothetical protein NT062_20385 [Proteobacteria bacterium]|nr:hypothetical protein [Pseudomonadota bacterium]
MDLEILEALALANDRPAALAQLLPGSEDHDYYRGVAAMHRGALDEADEILRTWPDRHGHTARYHQLRTRQHLHRLATDGTTAEAVRDWLGINHWHEAEVASIDPTRPTRIADDGFAPDACLQTAYDYDASLSQVTDEGLLELVGRSLDSTRRRVLLTRLPYVNDDRVVALIAEELDQRGSGAFGTLAIHDALTRAQLEQLVGLRPKLRETHAWVGAVVRRMRPHARVDLELDRDERARYLADLWTFVAPLPASLNSLKAHVLWHALDTARRRSTAELDGALVDAYLALPRAAGYLAPSWITHVKSEEIAQLHADYRAITGLPLAGDDEELVRYLLHRAATAGTDPERWARYFYRTWLELELATSKLLRGAPGGEQATLVLGPARAAALRERVEIAWVPHVPTAFAEAAPVALEVDVKNVAELVVKVFRVDPLAYYQHAKREVSTDLDLDGLAASHEELLRFTEAPVRRVRRRIELPACARPGTYIVDLIGNGKSSRVVIYKGRLRHVARIGAAGHVVTIVDERGALRPDARAWIGGREYVPDARASFVVPFSTAPARTPMLLAASDVATVQHLELQRETYELDANVVLDRSALVAGRTARALARVALRCTGQAASLELLERPTWDVTLTDRAGVATTRSQPLTLVDGQAAILEWQMGDDIAHVALALRGSVKVISEHREEALARTITCEVARIDGTVATEALYLAHTDAGWVISALGKTGEPRARRPITVSVVHRWSRMQHNYELATDDHGRIELGRLPGAIRITATLGTTQTWELEDPEIRQIVQLPTGRDVVVPLPATRTAADTLARLALVELRANVPARDALVDVTIEPLEAGLAIRGLPAGDYLLRTPGHTVRITIADAGPELGTAVVTPAEIVDTRRPAPAIAALDVQDDLRVTLRGATKHTRVHVLATRFRPALVEPIARTTPSPAARRPDRTHGALYLSGRELGDEYRYILERRNAARHPTLLLERPSLLLNPWARRTTTTDVQTASAGEAYGRMAPHASAPAPMPRPMAQAAMSGDLAYVGYAFLPEPPVALANLSPDEHGVVRIARTALARATTVTIVVDDPAGSVTRTVQLAETPLDPRDLRLSIALDPARHATQAKRIFPLRAGERLVIDDLATAKVHLIDSVERAHQYLLALRDDPTLREFAFVTRWHGLPDGERRELYSKYACHELHLFLYFKDRDFFDGVVRPYLAHKRTKTFVDHYLLGADLIRFLEPIELLRLNAIERALLAQRLLARPAVARILADQVAMLPPDPGRDTRLIDALLGAAALDGDETIAGAQGEAMRMRMDEADALSSMAAPAMLGAGFGGPPPPPSAPAPMAHRAMAPAKSKKMSRARSEDDGEMMKESKDEAKADVAMEVAMEDAPDDLGGDRLQRAAQRPMFRAADKTQEYAENNWWHLLPQQGIADYVAPNRWWRDFAAWTTAEGGAFLSPWLGLATTSFAEAMCALAVVDLPFVPAKHAIEAVGPRLTIVAAGNALAGTSQLVDGELVASGPPLVVGQNFVRTDDRYDWSTGEQVDKYIDGAFAVGVVYTCQIVLANPSSSRQRIAALIQIPRGSLPVAGAKPTTTIDVVLEPYGTHGHEYAFYVPAPGLYPHFPVHVSRAGVIVAAAPTRALEVIAGGAAPDPRSWAHVSQHGSTEDVVAYLATANLAATDLTRLAWRLRTAAAYATIVAALERRDHFDPVVWGYALLHGDRDRTRVALRANGARLLEAGPIVEPFGIDAEQFGAYEHLEYAPLINARAHRLGGKLRILNDGFAAQYQRFLDHVAHRATPSSEDLLAAAAYFLVQDRHAETLATLARVNPEAVADRMQHDYLAAYAACLGGDAARARALASRWRDLPVDRWRRRFEALLGMLDEVADTHAAPEIIDPTSRDQQHAEAAARQPTFELAVDKDGVLVRSQHVTGLELRYFEMDVELLFSRQPFVASDVSRFSFIEPGHRERLEGELPREQRVPWAAGLRGKNVVVEGVGAGIRQAKVHYANDLATNLAHQYGQVRVQRASDHGPLAATYVKVYARKRGGAVSFYKDGYTDLRGWFDYASLSTTDLDDVERFAILVCSDAAGAAILETAPPQR